MKFKVIINAWLDDMDSIYLWLNENVGSVNVMWINKEYFETSGSKRYYYSCFYFKNEEDATLFKLKFNS